ncbi:MAG TPA: PDZ domain-containing protein [Longimicrobiales bacterium]
MKGTQRIGRRGSGKQPGPWGAARRVLGALAAAALALAPSPGAAQAGSQPPSASRRAAPERVPGTGWLGVGVDTRFAYSDGAVRESIVITWVEPGSPAERAGLRTGDTVVRINGDDGVVGVFRALPFSLAVGDTVRFVVQRHGRDRPVTVIAGERPRRYRLRWVVPEDRLKRLTIELMDSARAAALAAIRLRGMVADSAGEQRRMVEVALAARQRRHARMQDSLLRIQDSLLRLHASAAAIADRARGAWLFGMDTAALRWFQPGRADAAGLAAGAHPAVLPERIAVFPPGVHVIHALGQRGVAGAEFVEMNDGLAQYFGGVEDGLLTLRVAPATPAARARLEPGDVVVSVDGRPVRTVGDLRAALVRDGAGGPRVIRLGIVRKGERRELRLTADQL